MYARFREEAQVGWEALKVFVDMMEVDEELQCAIKGTRALDDVVQVLTKEAKRGNRGGWNLDPHLVFLLMESFTIFDDLGVNSLFLVHYRFCLNCFIS